jgi:hypothetical protein
VPLTRLSPVFGKGLAGKWSGLSTFMVLRLGFGGWRVLRKVGRGRHRLTPCAAQVHNWLRPVRNGKYQSGTLTYSAVQ